MGAGDLREAPASFDGRLELQGLLGAGGMGEVYRAWDLTLKRAVAVKFFRGGGEREEERLLLEGRLQAQVDHPHIVRIYDAGTLAGHACLVLQLVVGGQSLAELAPSLAPSARVELVRQAALGVHAAHLQGLVHRDVKPSNVLVEKAPGGLRALVSDFGLARGDGPGLTRSGLAVGTLAFMSPEQLLGDRPVSFEADIYGLGATLHAVLGGRPTRPGSPSRSAPLTPEELPSLRRLLEAPPPPLPPEVPAPLSRVVAKAMSKAPSERYPSAAALAEDLARFQRGEPVLARPAGWAERALAWIGRNRGAARALGTAVAVVLVALGWTVWSGQRANDEALKAARYGALGESMEAQLRMEYLSPLHDLQPALAQVRAQVEVLKAEEGRGGGAASFALGKGLELLGDVDGARAAYERAWGAGFRIGRVAEGLGSALGAQYRRAHQRALETIEPSARGERLAALQAELRDPAIRSLALADAGGPRAALLEAAVALLEGNWSTARARADEVLADDPSRYEARALQAETYLEEAQQEKVDGHLEPALVAAARAIELLEEAARWARSDPALAKAMARAHLRRLNILTRQGKQGPEELTAATEHLALATALWADDPELLQLRAGLLLDRGDNADVAAPAEYVLRLYREAAELYRRAERLGSPGVGVLCGLASTLYSEAHTSLQRRGTDPRASIAEGLAALERAAARAPFDPEVHRQRAFLFSLEAMALSAAGEPTGRALRQSVEAGEEALRLNASDPTNVRRRVGDAYVMLGIEALESGRDPRPDLERGVALREEVLRARPGEVFIAVDLVGSHQSAAEVLFDIGEGERGEAHLARARELLRGLEAAQKEIPQVALLAGQHWWVVAQLRANTGQDPREAVAEARRCLDQASQVMRGDVAFELFRASLWVVEASGDRQRGSDPTGDLARAERELEALALRYPGHPEPLRYLAVVGLERALWLRRAGRDSTAPARRGLELLERAPRLARDPDHWAFRARLLALAGEREKAKESLEHCWAINSLAKGGYESKSAEAELAR